MDRTKFHVAILFLVIGLMTAIGVVISQPSKQTDLAGAWELYVPAQGSPIRWTLDFGVDGHYRFTDTSNGASHQGTYQAENGTWSLDGAWTSNPMLPPGVPFKDHGTYRLLSADALEFVGQLGPAVWKKIADMSGKISQPETQASPEKQVAQNKLVAPTSLGTIASLNAKITSLRFFEGGHTPPSREQRQYSSILGRSKTRYVHWELSLENPAPGRRIDFVIEQYWYHPNGGLLSRQTSKNFLNPEPTSSFFSHSFGWPNSGNWPEGIYRVDFYVEGQKVTSGTFEIYSSASAGIHFPRGIDYFDKGMYDEAITEYGKAIEQNPKQSLVFNNRCLSYYKKKLYDQAITDCTQAIELNRNHLAYHNRALAYDFSKQYDRAIADFTKAIELNPKHHISFNNRGNIYASEKQRYDQAIADYNKALQINPKYSAAYYSRSISYYRKGKLNDAWKDVTKAQELGYQADEDFLEALRKARQDAKEGKTPDTFAYRGTWLETKGPQGKGISRSYHPYTSGDHASQIAEYTKAIQVQEEQGETVENNIILASYYVDRAEVKRAMGRAEEADREIMDIARKSQIGDMAVGTTRIIEITTRRIAREPNNAELYEMRAEAYDDERDYGKGLADRTKVIELAKNNKERARAYSNRSLTYHWLDNQAAYLADINKAIELHPASWDYFNRAQTFKKMNEPSRAIDDYTVAIRLLDEEKRSFSLSDYLRGRADAYYQIGKFEQARTDLDEVLKANLKDVTALSLRALVLLELKQDVAAKVDMETLKKVNSKYYRETFQPKMEKILERRKASNQK